MGWTVLYIAFGVVALWLLGEVLLQYKARLRWRLLAFAGFVGVVLGVLIPSVLVIAVGAIAFATGQTYVTLSFRRGFSTGWAIGGSPGESRRRRAAGDGPSRKPTLEVSGLEYQEPDPDPDPTAATQASAVYEPQPLPDDTGQYGIYTDAAYAAAGSGGGGRQQQGEQQYGAYDPYTDYAQPAQDTYSGQGTYGGQDAYSGQDTYSGQDAYSNQGAYPGQDSYPGQETYQGQDSYAGQYDYGTPAPDYTPYSDPYIGTGAAAGAGQYTSYDNGYDSYGGQQQYTGPYAEQYASETPPGGVWVPQQREGEQYPPLPPEQPPQPAPYGNGYDTGQNEQYRY